MLIEIKREKDDPNSVPSQVFVNGNFVCYGMEPSRTKPVHEGHPCILAGRFVVVLTLSPHLHYVTPELLRVPNRSNIRIHIANFPKEILGCLAVGTDRAKDEVLHSRDAFNKLMNLLQPAWEKGEKIEAVYTDPS